MPTVGKKMDRLDLKLDQPIAEQLLLEDDEKLGKWEWKRLKLPIPGKCGRGETARAQAAPNRVNELAKTERAMKRTGGNQVGRAFPRSRRRRAEMRTGGNLVGRAFPRSRGEGLFPGNWNQEDFPRLVRPGLWPKLPKYKGFSN